MTEDKNELNEGRVDRLLDKYEDVGVSYTLSPYGRHDVIHAS
ncbi:hypothetical protein MHI57_22905 [Cytobacillus sp. FSL K6-0129]